MTAPARPRVRAACELDPELWFRGLTPSDQLAAHVCRHHCPLRGACGRVAVELRPQWGVWGGVLWVRVRNRAYGQQGGHQPINIACSEQCEPWRDGGRS